jgi:hypothetical protein
MYTAQFRIVRVVNNSASKTGQGRPPTLLTEEEGEREDQSKSDASNNSHRPNHRAHEPHNRRRPRARRHREELAIEGYVLPCG